MSRRRKANKREILPDPKFGDLILSKFMTCLMMDGKKYSAEKIVYGAFDRIKDKSGNEPLDVFKDALEKVKPQVEVRSRRVGGATYQVPVEIRPKRRVALAHRWVVEAARSNKGQSIEDSLYTEFLNAVNNTGNAIKKKEDSHRMAEANRAFAHYRW